MIFDSLDNIRTYFSFKEFSPIIDRILSLDISSPNGSIDIGEGNYIKVMTDKTRINSEIIESHQKEVDIQILLKGSELIKIYNINEVEVKTLYNPEIDCQFYSNPGNAHNQLILKEGYFAVFYPQDIHNPLNAVDNVEALKKIVVKLNLKWLQEKIKHES
ncbi:MAG: YhcH/YjgK/YiaL family protein [Oceanospirillaceae bacterium]|nr:YhcH/YjgK/YiaL family protein [Oceanospirillaceae bacterium]